MKTATLAWAVFLVALIVGAAVWLTVGLLADQGTTTHGKFLGPHAIHTVQ